MLSLSGVCHILKDVSASHKYFMSSTHFPELEGKSYPTPRQKCYLDESGVLHALSLQLVLSSNLSLALSSSIFLSFMSF